MRLNHLIAMLPCSYQYFIFEIMQMLFIEDQKLIFCDFPRLVIMETCNQPSATVDLHYSQNPSQTNPKTIINIAVSKPIENVRC